MKKHLLRIIFVLILIIFIISGCDNVSTELTVLPSETVSASPAETPAPTPSPTLEPTPTPTPDPMQEKLQLAPDIEGLTKAIEEKDGIQKVVYRYIVGNPYGGVVGEYAGQFKKEVTFKSNETDNEIVPDFGGVILMPNVVKELYIETNFNWSTFSIPLDISGLDTENVVIESDTDYCPPGLDNLSGRIVKISFEGATVPFINISYGAHDIPTKFWYDKDVGPEGNLNWIYDIFGASDNRDRFHEANVVSRTLTFSGEFSIKVTEAMYDPQKRSYDIGIFGYGDVICNVSNQLDVWTNIAGGNVLPISNRSGEAVVFIHSNSYVW